MRPGRTTKERFARRSHTRSVRPTLEGLETRHLLANFLVTTTSDTPVAKELSLREAMTLANANPGPDTIAFSFIPKNIPGVIDYNAVYEAWTIHVDSALPTITDLVSIDGYSQHVLSLQDPANEVQTLELKGPPTAGSFTLTFQNQTTDPIPFDAGQFAVQSALENLSSIGPGNVSVELGNTGLFNITFQNKIGYSNVDPLVPNSGSLVGGLAVVATTTQGASGPITSDPNVEGTGFNASVRVVLDGSVTDPSTGLLVPASFPGLTIQSDHNRIRGLSIDGFRIGVSVEGPDAVGNLIQGNYIGKFVRFINPSLKAGTTNVGGIGNGLGVQIASPSNNTVGGVDPQTHNGIAGNLTQGVRIAAGAIGNQVVGNLIGVLEESPTVYFQVPNGQEGILVESASNAIGGAVPGSTNVISANGTYGIHVVGPDAVRNRIEANYIGTDITGSFIFGQGNPGNGQFDQFTGNLRDGIFIDNAPSNQIGIPGGTFGVGNSAGNVISGNFGAGVRISGALAIGNLVQGNIIGSDILGTAALPNFQEGVAIFTARNTVGGLADKAGNLISGNRVGVLLSGSGASGNLIAGNLIGTDGTGAYDLGNSHEGVRIDSAPNNTIGGLVANALNLISGNDVGILIVGSSSTGNLVIGNQIGTDLTGTLDLGNSREGVRIEDAMSNTIGGGTTQARNLISANHWGVTITGPGSYSDLVQGNFIGTDVTGTLPVPNEIDGVLIVNGAANNEIGGDVIGLGNTIAFNLRNGVRIESNESINNAILSNSIFSNGSLGIDLVAPGDPASGVTPITPGGPHTGPNHLQNAPVLTLASSNISNSTTILGTLDSSPNATFVVQFFSNIAADPSGFGEGKTLLGTASITTNGAGTAPIDSTFLTAVPAGQFITATATDSNGNTSEFSNAIVVQSLPGQLQFSMSNYVVDETAGTATITVTRANGSSGTVTVDYATSDATPGAQSDYIPTSGTLTFLDGEISKSFTITILADGTFHPDQLVRLTLSNPQGGATLGTPNPAILTIRDTNSPIRGVFQFSQSGYNVSGGSGSATITVTRAGGADGIATVDYATSNGSGIAGVDYTPMSGTLVFNDGETSKQIVIPILDSVDLVGNRTVNLTLTNPTGGTSLGSPSEAVLTIRDSVGPTVQSVRFLTDRGGGIVSLVVTFSEPLNPSTAVNLLNYAYSVRTAGRDHKFGTRDDLLIPFRGAALDSTGQIVTLRLGRGIHPPTPFLFAINGSTNVSGAGVGVSDLAGNLLGTKSGSTIGVPFVAVLSGRTGGYPTTPVATSHARIKPSGQRSTKMRLSPRGPLSHTRPRV